MTRYTPLSPSVVERRTSAKAGDKPRFALLAVDPGQVHVGYALWHHEGTFSHGGEVGPEDIVPLLRDTRPTEVVIEAFSLRSPKFGVGASKQAVDTILLIGRLLQACDDLRTPVFLQQPSVRGVAQKSPFWTALVKDNDLSSNPHSRSAVAHGVYHLNFRG